MSQPRACKIQSCRETPTAGLRWPRRCREGPFRPAGQLGGARAGRAAGCLSLLCSSSPANNKPAVRAGRGHRGAGLRRAGPLQRRGPQGLGTPVSGTPPGEFLGPCSRQGVSVRAQPRSTSFIHSFIRTFGKQAANPGGEAGYQCAKGHRGAPRLETPCRQGLQDRRTHTLQTLQRANPPVGPQERPFGHPWLWGANLEEVSVLWQPLAPQV